MVIRQTCQMQRAVMLRTVKMPCASVIIHKQVHITAHLSIGNISGIDRILTDFRIFASAQFGFERNPGWIMFRRIDRKMSGIRTAGIQKLKWSLRRRSNSQSAFGNLMIGICGMEIHDKLSRWRTINHFGTLNPASGTDWTCRIMGNTEHNS